MNQYITAKGTMLAQAATSLCFLVIHIAMLVLFRANGVEPMVYVNIGSIAFYLIAGLGIWNGEIKVSITATIGVAWYESGQSVAEWVNAADRNLYAGKSSGKNRVVV